MKNHFFVLTILFFYSFCVGQENKKIDSLNIEYKKSFTKKEKVKNLTLLLKHSKRHDISLYKKYAYDLLNLVSNDEGFSLGKNDALRSISYYFLRTNKLDSVKYYDDLLIANSKKNSKRPDLYISALINKSNYYKKTQKKDSVVYFLYKAKRIIDTVNINNKEIDTKRILVYLNLIQNLINEEKYDESLNYCEYILEFCKKKNNFNFMYFIHGFIGTIYFEQKNYSKSLEHYKEELKISTKLNNKVWQGFSKLHIGKVELKIKEYGNCLKNFKSAYNIFKKKKYSKGITNALKNLTIYYDEINDKKNLISTGKEYNSLKRNNPKSYEYGLVNSFLYKANKVEKHKTEAKNVVKHLENGNTRSSLLSYRIMKNLGEYEKALELHEKYFNNKEIKIISNNYFTKLSEFETKYQTQQKENKILKLANENEKQKVTMARTRLLLFSIIGLVVLLGGIGYFIRHKRKQQQQLELLEKTIEASDNEKNRIGRELHDGIASKILQLVHNAENLNEEYTHKLQNVYTEIRGLSHQLNQTPVHVEEPIFERLLEITDGIQLKVNLEITPISLIVKEPTATHIYRIVQELVANTIKHAKASNITLNLSQPKNDLVLKYTDDGKGFSDEVRGKGLQNIKHRVNVLKGEITYKTEPNNGFSTQITIPL